MFISTKGKLRTINIYNDIYVWFFILLKQEEEEIAFVVDAKQRKQPQYFPRKKWRIISSALLVSQG